MSWARITAPSSWSSTSADVRGLEGILRRIDGRGYKAYKELQGRRFGFDSFRLSIDHVQGDPYATPSRLRVRVPLEAAGPKPC